MQTNVKCLEILESIEHDVNFRGNSRELDFVESWKRHQSTVRSCIMNLFSSTLHLASCKMQDSRS